MDLTARVFRPARPRLDEVRGLLAKIKKVPDAVRELESNGFEITAPSRGFTKTGNKPHPATVAELVTFAADLDGIRAVERAAVAFSAAACALYPRRKPNTKFVWRFAPPDSGNEWWFNGTAPYAGDVIVNFAATTKPVPSIPPDLEERLSERARFHVGYVLAYDAAWRQAALDGKTVSDMASSGVTGKPLAELDNPFTHLVAILERGYAYTGVDGASIYLLAPLAEP